MKYNVVMKMFLITLLTIIFTCKSVIAYSKEITNQEIEVVVKKALKTFHTPGMAIAIVHKNNVEHLAGYGYSNIKNQTLVDSKTLFRIASTTKAFTVASLAILVDDGVLNWDDKVTKYIPEFQMKEHWVTEEFTIGDLLTHRSGLVDSAGDSMLWPEPSGFTRKEIIHNLRYLTPEYSFRSTYAYSNVMYVVAGEIIARVTNMSWESFVEKRIFKPLGMQCYAGGVPENVLSHVAMPYGYRDAHNYEIPRNSISGLTTVSAPAGGIACNAEGMAKWIKMLLNESVGKKTNKLFSKEQLSTIWQSRTILPMSKEENTRNRRHFRTYGYGWRMSDYLGYQLISHTGTISGMQAYVAMIPELELGVVLLNNGSNSNARSAVMQTLLRSYIQEEKQKKVIDWVDDYLKESLAHKNKSEAEANLYVPKGTGKVLFKESAYVGIYKDEWFGSAHITNSATGLRLYFPKMPTLKGSLEAFDKHSFVVRWDNKNAAEDAFVHFKANTKGSITSFTMYPFTLKEKISHEYRDMNFIRKITELNH